MKEEDIKAFTDSIKEKLGEENMAMISDDLGTLMTHNSTAISEAMEKDNEALSHGITPKILEN